MKKRVLQLIGSFHQGGSERQAVGLTRMLVEAGVFDVHAATLNKEGILLTEIDSLGLEVPEYKLTSFYNANFVKQVRRCAKYIKDNGIDIVHTHDFYTNVFGMAAASLAGVRAIAAKRETAGMRSRPQEMIENIAFGRAHAIVANSEAVRAHLIERSIDANKVRVIYNGLDISRFDGPFVKARTLTELGLPDRKLVTIVANLRHAVKNIPMLLRAAITVVESHPDTHFVIAGEGELKDQLVAQAVELGIANSVHFIGRCTQVPALISASYAGVLTSTAEGFSNSILEYMAAGKPVVATNVGGAAEAIVEGETGHLVASNDADALSARLIELLDDGAKAQTFGEAGRNAVNEKFSTERQLAKTEALYAELTS